MKTLWMTWLGVSFMVLSNAQITERCGAGLVLADLLQKYPNIQQTFDEIEVHTQAQLATLSTKRTRATVYRIPVVVHVIHNGQAVGSGANISLAQINSQLTVLNKDYRLLNSDSLPTSHAFYGVTDDCEIEFCLATRDPSNNPTSGINRYNMGASDYDYFAIENNIKPITYWDNKKYLNIWVVTFGGSTSSLLGYATPPGSPADQDGIVINTTNFGSTGNVTAPYNKGRTATHEIGHYLNLRHIWGDATCGNDQVSDTAPAEEANYGCPSFPHNPGNACGTGSNGEMFMNYMDYTNDNCMKMFTTGQKNRMRAVLNAGGSRNSLTTSTACTWPTQLDQLSSTDALIQLFPNPNTGRFHIRCSKTFAVEPEFALMNIFGQVVGSGLKVQKESADLYAIEVEGQLPSGTYFVQIRSGNQSANKLISILR